MATPCRIFIPEFLTMDGAPRPDVFISYSTKDELIAPRGSIQSAGILI